MSVSISIDFETGSHADLRKVGAAKYAEDPTTRVLCMAWAPSGDIYGAGSRPQIWREGEQFPGFVLEHVKQGGRIRGWNAGNFEYWIWNVVLRRQLERDNFTYWFPFPRLTFDAIDDTMIEAAAAGLPLGLDDCAAALPHLGIRKDKTGHALMLRMCRPRDRKADTWWHLDDPAKYDALCDYCVQDVVVESKIADCLPLIADRERLFWKMDQVANMRGMLLDVDLCDRIELLAASETARLDQLMHNVTHSEVPNTRSVGKLLLYAQKYEPTIKSLAKDKLKDLLDNHVLHPDLRKALLLRQEAAKSSVAKVRSMKNFACMADHRMRGLYQFYGAFRTGRDAGRGPQIQNYPRGTSKNPDQIVKYIKDGGDPDGFPMFFGMTCMEGLSNALRGCVTVPDNKYMCS